VASNSRVPGEGVKSLFVDIMDNSIAQTPVVITALGSGTGGI
jgi:hypothetical protein